VFEVGLKFDMDGQTCQRVEISAEKERGRASFPLKAILTISVFLFLCLGWKKSKFLKAGVAMISILQYLRFFSLLFLVPVVTQGKLHRVFIGFFDLFGPFKGFNKLVSNFLEKGTKVEQVYPLEHTGKFLVYDVAQSVYYQIPFLALCILVIFSLMFFSYWLC
jgi:hypothetical protein